MRSPPSSSARALSCPTPTVGSLRIQTVARSPARRKHLFWDRAFGAWGVTPHRHHERVRLEHGLDASTIAHGATWLRPLTLSPEGRAADPQPIPPGLGRSREVGSFRLCPVGADAPLGWRPWLPGGAPRLTLAESFRGEPPGIEPAPAQRRGTPGRAPAGQRLTVHQHGPSSRPRRRRGRRTVEAALVVVGVAACIALALLPGPRGAGSPVHLAGKPAPVRVMARP